MSEQMLGVVRRLWDEVWKDNDIAVIDEIVAERYVRHNSSGTTALSREELKAEFVQYQRALHSPVTTVDSWASKGDVIFVRATIRGMNIETQRSQVMTWMASYRLEDDRISEGWIATVPGVDWQA